MIQRRDLATWTKIFHLLRVSMISDKMRAGDGGPGQQRPDGGLRFYLLLAAARPWIPLTWMDAWTVVREDDGADKAPKCDSLRTVAGKRYE